MPRKQPEPDPLLTTEDVCDLLGVPVTTLYKWRERKSGPKGFKVGKRIRWRRSEINRWLAEQGDTAARERTV